MALQRFLLLRQPKKEQENHELRQTQEIGCRF